MPSFHPLAIKDIKRETADCVSISFAIPGDLKNEFAYKQGQYITLKLTVGGEALRRSYSACSSPLTDEDLRIAVKKVDDGRASAYLNNGIKVGDRLEVMKPMGNFYTPMPAAEPKRYVAFAAGSGITPILSLLKTALAAHAENHFTLIYGNRSKADIIFKKELDELSRQYASRLSVLHILSREQSEDPLFEGRISPQKCESLVKEYAEVRKGDEYFLCGPYDMIEELKVWLASIGVAKEHIHFELFTSDPPKPELDEATKGTFTAAAVTVVLDGEETVVEVDKDSKILDAVLDAGLDAPYACTGGSCCTCRAKVLEGSVRMEVNYALTDEEVAEGYVLTCQSHPTTPAVVVDYDAP